MIISRSPYDIASSLCYVCDLKICCIGITKIMFVFLVAIMLNWLTSAIAWLSIGRESNSTWKKCNEVSGAMTKYVVLYWDGRKCSSRLKNMYVKLIHVQTWYNLCSYAEHTVASAKWSKNGEVLTAKANMNSWKRPTDERKRKRERERV